MSRGQLDKEEIMYQLREILDPAGFECHPFQLGWYNDAVGQLFKLDYPDDTLAVVVISTPAMFDKAFKPYLQRQQCLGIRDPIDQCIAHHFELVQKAFIATEIEAIHDFELTPTRRPKVLVQTAGHVAGAAYYYQRCDVKDDPWGKDKKIFGVSVHPKYGGWFALRGVLIFKGVSAANIPRKTPVDIVQNNEKRIKLLERYNFNWQDWKFRDIIEPEDRYSEEQKTYFATPPRERMNLIKSSLEFDGMLITEETGDSG